MSKKFFAVPWIVACVLMYVPCVCSEVTDAVKKSVDKLISVSLTYGQSGIETEVFGSGTPIGNGVVITASHVVDNHDRLSETGFNMAQPISETFVGCYVGAVSKLQFPLKLRSLDKENDIAVLQADLRYVMEMLRSIPWNAREHRDVVSLYALLTKGIPIAKEPSKGDIYFAGFPARSSLEVGNSPLFGSTQSYILCEGKAKPGMSGGGILNEKGAVVGFITAKIVDRNGKEWVYGRPCANVLGKFK